MNTTLDWEDDDVRPLRWQDLALLPLAVIISALAFLIVMTALLLPSPARAQSIDPVARGLAARANTSAGISAAGGALAVRERIKRAALDAIFSNPEVLPAAAGVTLTQSVSHDSALSNQVTVIASPGAFRVTGGAPTVNTSNSRWYFRVNDQTPSNGNLNGLITGGTTLGAAGWEVETQTESDALEIVAIAPSTSDYFRVLVDGQYVSKTPTAYSTSGAPLYIKLDFAGVRKIRSIKFEGSQQAGIYGVNVKPTANLSAPTFGERVTVFVTGDSYAEGVPGPTSRQQAWPKVLGRMLGWSDVRQVAVAGTGYLYDSSGSKSKISAQIPRWLTVNSDLTADKIDIVLFAAGYNDSSFSDVAVAAEAANDFAAVRAAYPKSIILVFGVWGGARGPGAATLSRETAILAAASGLNDPNLFVIPVSTDIGPWLFGTGYVGATNGSGNSDFNIGSDGVHPNDLGAAVVASRGGSRLRDLFRAF